MHAHEYFSIATVFLSNYSYEVIVNDDIYNALRTITKEKKILRSMLNIFFVFFNSKITKCFVYLKIYV